MNTPKRHQLQESTAGEEDPGSGMDASDSAVRPDGVAPSAQQAYENSPPGAPGNDTAGRKPVDDVGVARTMEQTAQTDSERGSPGLTTDEIRAMKR